jgi:ketosteroid isomerase-like protein
MYEFRDQRCVARGADFVPQSLDDILNPRSPGLARDEMARRLIAMGSFSRSPDIALIRKLCSPDVVCEFVGDRTTVSHAGRHRGIEALINIVRSIEVEFEQRGFAMPEVIVDGGAAAARRIVEWRHRGTGRRGQVQLADFVRFEDGRIVEIVEFATAWRFADAGVTKRVTCAMRLSQSGDRRSARAIASADVTARRRRCVERPPVTIECGD